MIKEFLKIKFEQIPEYASDADLKIIDQWSEAEKDFVISKQTLTNCPYCIKYEVKCGICLYGKNHNKCNYLRNNKQNLTDSQLERMQTLLNLFKKGDEQ